MIAPTLIPVRPGVRVKTDRRDARKLAGLFRAGELTSIRIPPPEEEAVRDLIRAREDLSEDILRARHRLSKFMLRHDRVYREGKDKWTERHLAWVRRQRFETAGLEELVGHHLAIIETRLRQRELMDGAIARIASSEPYAAAVGRLCEAVGKGESFVHVQLRGGTVRSDIDPETGEEREADPEQPSLWQEPSDVKHNIWWLNLQSPDARFAFEQKKDDPRVWRTFHGQKLVEMVAQVHMQDAFTNLGPNEKPDVWANHKFRLESFQIQVTRPMWVKLTNYVLTGQLEDA